mmetsp:Transcript_7204/g.18346  ORF Transcript_7204/g.18346 Transcript_7204/m.18346 type:complete len:202 (-) Transcript_7204:361-966(-)
MAPAMLTLKPAAQVVRGSRSAFSGLNSKFRAATVSAKSAAPVKGLGAMTIQNIHGTSGRKCMLTGKKANNGYSVSFSHIRTKKLQHANLQYKRIYWPEQQRYIRMRISTKAMKTITKLGLEAMAAKAGMDLMAMKFTDADPTRIAWLKENNVMPVAKDKRASTGKAKLFIPAWKAARMAKKGQDVKAETARFAERWGMVVA